MLLHLKLSQAHTKLDGAIKVGVERTIVPSDSFHNGSFGIKAKGSQH